MGVLGLELSSVGITGTAFYVPETVLTNKDIVALGIDTSDEWIRTRIGVEERRIAKKNEATSDLAAEAAKKLMKKTGLTPEEIELIIVTTTTPDTITPSTACYVQEKIGAKNAGALDVNNACSGFNYGLSIAAKFVADGTYKKVLLIGAEAPSKFRDKNDRTTFVIFGDGAGAVLLEKVKKNFGLLASYLRADGSGAEKLYMPGGGTRHPISNAKDLEKYPIKARMDGKAIWDFAMKAIPDAAEKCLENADLTIKDVDFVVFHQANKRIIEEGMKILGLPMEKTITVIEKYANTISASIPIALDKALSDGKIKKGDIVLLIGFGAGLSWGANVLRWQ